MSRKTQNNIPLPTFYKYCSVNFCSKIPSIHFFRQFCLDLNDSELMNKELEKIIDNLETVFRGDAWHGPSVVEILNSLPPKVVDQKHGFSKRTISELVFHLVAWRKFIMEKLNDNIHYSLETDEDNWGTKEITSNENWPKLIKLLKDTQSELVALLEEKDDELLNKRVPGEHYDFYKLLTGMIQHDTYHLGMIWVLWK